MDLTEVGAEDPEVALAAKFPMEDTVVHTEDDGAECADGVLGSP